MPSGSYWGKSNVLCPFYMSDNKQAKQITCEWILPFSSITTRFVNKSDYMNQLIGICGKDYKSCPVYRSLMEEKYDKGK